MTLPEAARDFLDHPPWLELSANLVNLLSIAPATRNSVHTWWTGLIGCALFGWLFFTAQLYADVTLQIFFVITGLPFIVMIYASFLEFLEPPSMEAFSSMSLVNYKNLLGDDHYAVDPMINSTLLGIGSATATMILAATISYYVHKTRVPGRKILDFLIAAKRAGKSVAGYGAPGKGNTLLNYCGVRTDFIDYTVDRSPHRQGNFLPGSRIPIHHPDKVAQTKPDYLFLLAWNFREEVMRQMVHVREWGCRFVAPLPEVRVFD